MAMKKASIPGINQRLEGCEEVDGHEEGLYTWHNQRLEGCVVEVDGHEEGLYTWHKPEAGSCVEEVDGHEEGLYTWHKPEAGRLCRGSRWPRRRPLYLA